MKIARSLQPIIESDYSRRKVIVLLGARQVGKTTLLSQLAEGRRRVLWLNCDNVDDALLLEGRSSTELRAMLAPYDIAFIDEAQRVAGIGLTLKKIGDLRLETVVIVTGSSSLDLADEVYEPATGRLIEYRMFPFSLPELAAHSTERDERRLLATRMIFGLYPEVVTDPSHAKQVLMHLADSYLYKDLLSFRGIKKPDLIQKLVRALALQLGSEVSFHELAQLLGVDRGTVESYINLLEKCFVVFRLDSYSRNLRNEIKKGKKIYFYDNGIRNAVLSNFAPLELRTDCGPLWENLMVSERVKRHAYRGSYAQLHFWRTHNQQEIDLIEEEDGQLRAYEFKWNPAKARTSSPPRAFVEAYPQAAYQVVTPDDFWDFLL